MATVHDILEARGKRAALEAGIDRAVVEAAAKYLGDEDNALACAYSGWAQCALPHKRIADDQPWKISSERVSLVVEPGRVPVGNDFQWTGVPFGAHARLILVYLQTEALRTRSREIELGGSLRQWMGRIGVAVGGKTGRSVRDQAERISRCRLSFHISTGGRASGLVNQSIVDRALFIDDPEDGPRQGRLNLETAKLSEGFFEQLQKHPVPLEEAAIKALNNNSPALDVYIWLAYRLHSLPAPRTVTWKALMGQFGTSYKKLFHFKPEFQRCLALATAVYPAAKVEVSDEGVVLKPSRPPVLPKVHSQNLPR
jgi:hypothetical protein